MKRNKKRWVPILYFDLKYKKYPFKIKVPFYDYVAFGYLHDEEYKNPN